MKIGIDLQKNLWCSRNRNYGSSKKTCICEVELKREFVNEARSEDLIQSAAQGDKQIDEIKEEAKRYGGWSEKIPRNMWLEFQEGEKKAKMGQR